MHRLKAMALAAATLVSACKIALAEDEGLGVPLDCEPGVTCFFQQYADMQNGKGVVDPFCGKAAYEGHRGSDIRVPSMPDIEKSVPVLAVADGIVRAIRDGEEDHPVRKKSEWPRFKDKHCGNGAIIDHNGGLQSQYCHLRKGSMRVRRGDHVEKGEAIGQVGSSGMAAFPHLHISIRKDGETIEPFTGKPVGSGCLKSGGDPLWSKAALDFFDKASTHVMALGMAGRPPDYDKLMPEGPPPDLKAGDRATVGWGWFLNLEKGDRLHFKITAPDGSTYTETETKPLGRHKAAYMQFAGRGRSPAKGDWTLQITLKRDGAVVETRTKTVTVR
ncbi:M23 family metallopeptidase [Fulvimarina sp. MAC3]|uniref:M23 family metallopeptidase n=1 Tax=Fulvimarina sp. MAC3 TaxID=3148887 RepID=UPI0031FBF308